MDDGKTWHVFMVKSWFMNVDGNLTSWWLNIEWIYLSCWWISNDCLRAQPSKLQSNKVISNEWHFQMNCIVFILCQTSVTLNTKLLWLSLTVVELLFWQFQIYHSITWIIILFIYRQEITHSQIADISSLFQNSTISTIYYHSTIITIA